MLASEPENPDIKSKSKYHITRAREMGGNSSDVNFYSSKFEWLLNNKVGALNYIDRAIKLDSTNTDYKKYKKSLVENN